MKRLRSQTGESITETLVALLIASLGLIILAGAISATSRVVLKTDHVLEEYYHQNNAVAEQSDSEHAAQISKITITSSLTEDSFAGASFSVDSYRNDYYPNMPVISYHEKESESAGSTP